MSFKQVYYLYNLFISILYLLFIILPGKIFRGYNTYIYCITLLFYQNTYVYLTITRIVYINILFHIK